MSHDCFISYSSKDLVRAEQFHARLLAAGIPKEHIWFDKIRLEPGFDWHREIEAGCESSRVLLPLLTPNWKQSDWTKYETYGAENVIPLLVEGKWEEVSTPPLTRYQSVPLSFHQMDRLVAAIRACCKRPVAQRSDRLVLLPHDPIQHFVGRDQLLTEIHESLFRNPTAALTQGHIQAVTALGGVGKTTVARHYAEKFWRPYRQIFWIDSRAGLETGFARIHDKLRKGPGFEVLPQEVKAAWARDELRSPQRELTLLILDNAGDQDSVTPWLPQAGNVHTLITSRFTAWTGAIEKSEVWVLEKEPARDLLMKSSGMARTAADTAQEREQADRVAEKLEYLPLALEQAAAYVRGQPQGFGFEGYLRLYGDHERRLLDAGTEGATDYPASVFLTWRTTVDRLPEGARRILRMHAYLAPTPFPINLYVKGAKAIEPDADEFDVRQWIGALLDYSMASRAEHDAIAVHGLVQAVERHRAQEDGTAENAYLSMRKLFGGQAASPSWEAASRQLWDILLPHAVALRGRADLLGVAAERDTLVRRLFSFLSRVRRGRYEYLWHARVRDHAGLLWKMGEAYRQRGDYRNAIPPYEEVVAIEERVLGAEHPDTLSLVSNLALLYESQGRYGEAEPLLRRVLEARERVLGAEHPDTLQSVNNLAMLYQRQGQYVEAEPLYRRALEAMERVPGAEHPDTLSLVSNLAALYYSQGLYGEAEPLYRRALEARERALGAEHPDTLKSVNNLALLYYSQGRYGEAEPLFRRALEARERVLGAEHPDTLSLVNNLALLYESQGRYGEAEPLVRRALEARERVLGAEHPDTLRSVNDLAGLYDRQGRDGEAEPLFRRALEERERVLGAEHPDTLQSVSNVALLYERQGRCGEAEPLFRRALEAMERVLGAEHPDTLQSVNNLAALYCREARYGEAEPLCRRALEARERMLGAEHPDTLQSVNNLAALYCSEARYSEAEPLFRRALEGAKKVFGANHQTTRTVAKNHADCLAALNRS